MVQPGQSSVLPGSNHTKVLWGCWLLCWKPACLHILLSRKPFILLSQATAHAGSLGPCLHGQILPLGHWAVSAGCLWLGLSGGAGICSEPGSRCCLPSCGKGSMQHTMCSLTPAWHLGSNMSHHFETDRISMNNWTAYSIFNPLKIMLMLCVSCHFDIHSFHVSLPQHTHFKTDMSIGRLYRRSRV